MLAYTETALILRQVRIPFNVNNMHCHLLVLNFDKEEIQVLNSLPLIRDEAKETTLVECIQTCIIEAVQGGLVQTPGPINITEWKKVCYTNIPQQEDGYYCGSYTLKYMLYWDGEKMTDDFTQAQIHIFNWKICTSLLRSDCNTLRLESYEKPILKKAYKARMAKLDKDNAADDDIQVISNPNDASKKEESPPNDASIKEISPPRPIGSQKLKRGCPRKIETLKPTNPVKDQYKLTTDAVTGLVEGRARRKSNPGPQQVSPYKEL
nr:uncharacterized protein LOC127333905 [Lolium perenne]